MIQPLDVSDRALAERLLEIQHRAYAVEAELIGFDGIPPLQEDLAGLMSAGEHWLGRYDGDVLVGAVAYEFPDDDTVDITRLIVDPAHARKGHGRALLDHLDQLEPARPPSSRPVRRTPPPSTSTSPAATARTPAPRSPPASPSRTSRGRAWVGRGDPPRLDLISRPS